MKLLFSTFTGLGIISAGFPIFHKTFLKNLSVMSQAMKSACFLPLLCVFYKKEKP
jgi:NRPS condensation-like uncharacterized protein